jgi:hypothetical protein
MQSFDHRMQNRHIVVAIVAFVLAFSSVRR